MAVVGDAFHDQPLDKHRLSFWVKNIGGFGRQKWTADEAEENAKIFRHEGFRWMRRLGSLGAAR
jgi:hypothetical protein